MPIKSKKRAKDGYMISAVAEIYKFGSGTHDADCTCSGDCRRSGYNSSRSSANDKCGFELPPPSGVIVQSPASPDPAVINSAAQHVFLPPRSLNAKLLLRVVIVLVAAALVGGAGYLKFQSARRARIKSDVMQTLKDAPSPTLRSADLRVWVSNDRDVTLDGAVHGIEDSALAEWLAGSVAGVSHVHNRLIVMPAVATITSESLVNKGIAFLDTGIMPPP